MNDVEIPRRRQRVPAAPLRGGKFPGGRQLRETGRQIEKQHALPVPQAELLRQRCARIAGGRNRRHGRWPFSPARTATGSRRSRGASGQTQRGE